MTSLTLLPCFMLCLALSRTKERGIRRHEIGNAPRRARQTDTDNQADDPYDAIMHMDFSHHDAPWTTRSKISQ